MYDMFYYLISYLKNDFDSTALTFLSLIINKLLFFTKEKINCIRPTIVIVRVQGSISPTYLRTAFTPVAPKSVRIQSSCQYLFMLLGSSGTKAALRALMKLSQG